MIAELLLGFVLCTTYRSTDCGGYEIDDDESEDVLAELAEVQYLSQLYQVLHLKLLLSLLTLLLMLLVLLLLLRAATA
jgi:hypothetical protein